MKVVLITGGKDPDEIARENPGKWRDMVEEAVGIYDFVLKKAIEKYPEGAEERIRRVAEETIPFFAKIEQEMERDRWIRKLAEAIGVSKESVGAEVEKFRKGLVGMFSEKKQEKETEETPWLKMVIGWLMLSNEDVVKEVGKWLVGMEFEVAEGKALIWILKNKEGGETKDLIDKMPSELKGVVEEAMMMKEMDEKPDKKDVLKLVGKILRDIVEEKINNLQLEIQKAEKAGKLEEEEEKYAEVVRLNKKYNEITAILA
jgi:DNA primase